MVCNSVVRSTSTKKTSLWIRSHAFVKSQSLQQLLQINALRPYNQLPTTGSDYVLENRSVNVACCDDQHRKSWQQYIGHTMKPQDKAMSESATCSTMSCLLTCPFGVIHAIVLP